MFSKIKFALLVFVIINLFILLVSSYAEAAEVSEPAEYRFSLNLLPWSYHHGKRGGQFNERHKGVGFSITNLNTRVTYGLMHYKNSQRVDGFSLSWGKEFKSLCVLQICPGIGAAWAPAYVFSGAATPFLGYLTFRYKFITIITLPGVVTTGTISIPLNF